MWISNWARMLPVINAKRSLVLKSLSRAVLEHAVDPQPLARVERELWARDVAGERGAIFELRLKGQLRAPSLHRQPLDLHSCT